MNRSVFTSLFIIFIAVSISTSWGQMKNFNSGSSLANLPDIMAPVDSVSRPVPADSLPFSESIEIRERDLANMPTAEFSEAASRFGWTPQIRYLSLPPTVYMEGEKLFFPHDGLSDISFFPLDMVAGIDVVSPLFNLLHGGKTGFSDGLNILLPTAIPPKDYTKTAALWGGDGRQRFSGMFIKRLGAESGFSVSGSELKGDNHRGEGGFHHRDYSAMSWGGYKGFKLRLFGFRHEANDDLIRPVMPDGSSLLPGHIDEDARLFHGKLSYSPQIAELSLRYTHQDYIRDYDGNPYGSNAPSHSTLNVDAGTISAAFERLWIADLDLSAGAHSYDVGDEAFRDYFASARANIPFTKSMAALLACRIERDMFERMRVSPMIGFKGPATHDLYFFLNAYRYDRSAAIDEFRPPFETDEIVWSDTTAFPEVDSSFFENRSVDSAWVERDLGAEGGFRYAPSTGLRFSVSARYTKTTDPFYWAFAIDTISGDTISFEWLPSGFGDELRRIPLSLNLEYEPDTLFKLGVRYRYSYVDSRANAVLYGIPEHRVLAFAQEKRGYFDGDGSLFLRLEGEGLFGLDGWNAGEKLDPVGIFRADVRLNYYTFSLFSSAEYAVTRKQDGWQNDVYVLEPSWAPPGYNMPKWSWRFGIDWSFLD